MKKELVDEVVFFLLKNKRQHYSCEEDTWYNCPAHPEAYNKHDEKNWSRQCECGADKYNVEVDRLIAKIIEDSNPGSIY